MRGTPALPILVALVLWISVPCPAPAIDVDGSLRGSIGSTDAAAQESDEEDGAFRLGLTQSLTPWLTLFGSFRATRSRSAVAGLPAFERTSVQPEIGLSYDRQRLNARLLFSERAIRTTEESQDLDIRTFLATLDWRPSRGPRLGFRFEDSTSTADAALFGRDSASRNFDLRADYTGASWNARYSFGLTEIDNRVTGLRLEQTRHELRAGLLGKLAGGPQLDL